MTGATCGDQGGGGGGGRQRLVARFPPGGVVAAADPRLAEDADHADHAGPDAEHAEHRAPWDVDDVDVLYVAGIPHGALDEPGRARLRGDRKALAALRPAAAVLSPMPVID